MSEATKRLRDAIALAASRIDSLTFAMKLAVAPEIHLKALAGALPDIRDELLKAIGEGPKP